MTYRVTYLNAERKLVVVRATLWDLPVTLLRVLNHTAFISIPLPLIPMATVGSRKVETQKAVQKMTS